MELAVTGGVTSLASLLLWLSIQAGPMGCLPTIQEIGEKHGIAREQVVEILNRREQQFLYRCSVLGFCAWIGGYVVRSSFPEFPFIFNHSNFAGMFALHSGALGLIARPFQDARQKMQNGEAAEFTLRERGASPIFFALLQGINLLEEAGVRSRPGAPFDWMDATAGIAGGLLSVGVQRSYDSFNRWRLFHFGPSKEPTLR